jgi:hypothetical protein
MKIHNMSNLCILLFILIVLGFLYRRFEDKLLREKSKDNYDAIQNYLLDDITLGKSKKPILWIHVPYEYNSRQWENFGSRSSFQLNQPYLHLTVRSIIKKCDKSFTICIFDDTSFKKLLPEWNIQMERLSNPILSNVRTLGMIKLLYKYGGMICPISFLCMRDLLPLYEKGTRMNKMFVCETIDRNFTSVNKNFYPTIAFCGAPKECKTVHKLCEYIQMVSSGDNSAESVFLGQYNRWCMKKVEESHINLIKGIEIGTKTIHDKQIIVDDLMSNNYLELYKDAYGILIPATDLLNRVHFEWFVRMSEKQVLQSDTIIGNYLLLSIGKEEVVLDPTKEDTSKWVGFWKTPLQAPVYGLKPNFLGNYVQKMH